MMNAIRAALAPSDSQDHVRVVCFLTDGYVGNDLDIIGEVKDPAGHVIGQARRTDNPVPDTDEVIGIAALGYGRQVGQIGVAVRLAALVTLLAGVLVLGGAIAASHRRRVYDAVVLKVLGATRGAITGAFLIEHGLLGVLTALVAGMAGTFGNGGLLIYNLVIGFLVKDIGYTPFFIGLAALDLVGAAVLWTVVREQRIVPHPGPEPVHV